MTEKQRSRPETKALDPAWFDGGHLSAVAIGLLAEGSLSDRDAVLLLSHLEACPACMDAYIAAVSAAEPEEAPPELSERILAAVAEEAAAPLHTPPTSRRRAALRVLQLSVAVCLTMLLFFSGVFEFLGKSSRAYMDRISLRTEEQTTSAPPKAPGESGWEKFSAGFAGGFETLVNQFNALFTGDERHES